MEIILYTIAYFMSLFFNRYLIIKIYEHEKQKVPQILILLCIIPELNIIASIFAIVFLLVFYGIKVCEKIPYLKIIDSFFGIKKD